MRKIFPDSIKADKIYVLPEPPSYDEKVLAAGLQGLAARTRKDQIFINANFGIDYLSIFKNDFGISDIEDTEDVRKLFPVYKEIIKGYILYKVNPEGPNSDPSVDIATSLAAQFGALIVSERLETEISSMGFECLLDVRGKDYRWLLSQKQYIDKLTKDLIINQYTHLGANLRDYAVATSAAYFYTNDSGLRGEFLKMLKPNSPVLGWCSGDFKYRDREGEYAFITQVSEHQLYTTPSHNINLSVLSGFGLDSIKQKAEARPVVKAEKKHYVCFMMTDGDNINWLMGGFNAESWYGNPHRGSFKMGWGMSPVMIDVGVPALKWLYENATEKDGFIEQVSGIGYMHPEEYRDETINEHMAILNSYMGKMDLNIIQVMNPFNFENELGMKMWDIYTKQPNIDALFYIGIPYHQFDGKMLFVNGKPVINSRYSLWRTCDDPVSLAEKLNSNPRDPESQDSYSVVSVHAWYEAAEGVPGNSMDAVKETVDLLDPSKVEVVTPQEFVRLIIENVKK